MHGIWCSPVPLGVPGLICLADVQTGYLLMETAISSTALGSSPGSRSSVPFRAIEPINLGIADMSPRRALPEIIARPCSRTAFAKAFNL